MATDEALFTNTALDHLMRGYSGNADDIPELVKHAATIGFCAARALEALVEASHAPATSDNAAAELPPGEPPIEDRARAEHDAALASQDATSGVPLHKPLDLAGHQKARLAPAPAPAGGVSGGPLSPAALEAHAERLRAARGGAPPAAPATVDPTKSTHDALPAVQAPPVSAANPPKPFR